MATRNFVPRANGEGGIGKSRKCWGTAYIEKIFVRAVEVLGGETENDAQPATVGWVKQGFGKLLKGAIEAAGLRYNLADNGYICFGSLFGGFIMQWGVHDASVGWQQDEKGAYIDIPYNIAQTTLVRPIAAHYGGEGNNLLSFIAGWHANEATTMRFRRVNIKGTQAYGSLQWISFGKE